MLFGALAASSDQDIATRVNNMSNVRSNLAPLATAAILATLCVPVSAYNMNTTIQEGEINTNDTYQRGSVNDNATWQQGRDNANRTRQWGEENWNETAQFGQLNYNETQQIRRVGQATRDTQDGRED
jgi:minor curlin subunit